MHAPIVDSCIVLILIGISWLTLTGAGLQLLGWLKFPETGSAERLFLAFTCGAGFTGTIIFLAAAAGLLISPLLYTVTVLLVAVAIRGWQRAGLSRLDVMPPPVGITEKISLVAALLLLMTALLLTLTPEIGKDALVYHLAAPKIYLKQHGFSFIPGNIFSNLPFQSEMLYLLALFLKGDVLAKGINFLALPMLMLGMVVMATRKLGSCYPYTGVFVFAMIPTVFELAHMAYADLYAALFVLAALYTFLQWQENCELPWIGLCGLFLGFALATKYSVLILPLLGFLGILVRFRDGEDGRKLVATIAVFTGAMIIVGAPFYLKNLVFTGNPLYPFFYSIFGGRGLDDDLARLFEGLYRHMGMGRQPIDYLLLPINVSFFAKMNSSRFDGLLSPIFLLLLPLLFRGRDRSPHLTTCGIFCATFFLFWVVSSQDIRYLTPILPLLAVFCGVVLTALAGSKILQAYAVTVILACSAFNIATIYEDFVKIRPLPVLLGSEARHDFLKRNLTVYGMYDHANRNLDPKDKVFLVNMKNYSFLADFDCFSDSMFESYSLNRLLSQSASPEQLLAGLSSSGFTHLMYDDNHVTGAKSLLGPKEIQLFSEFRKSRLQPVFSDHSYRLEKIIF